MMATSQTTAISDDDLALLAQHFSAKDLGKLGELLGYTKAYIKFVAKDGDGAILRIFTTWKNITASDDIDLRSLLAEKLREGFPEQAALLMKDFSKVEVAEAGVSEEILVQLADNIRTEEHAKSLARNLGFKEAAIQRYMTTNLLEGRVTYRGSLDMLYDWRDKTVPPRYQQAILKKALIDSGMARLAEDLPNTTPMPEDQCRSEMVFDHRGGELTIPSYGFTLSVPPGALKKGANQKITMKVLRDVASNIEMKDDEMIVTYGFQCLPSGLHFAADKPVLLKIPHCADLIDPRKIRPVLYSWNHDGLDENKPQRIEPTSRDCRVTFHNIEISLAHFSGGIFAFILDWWYVKGKRFSLMPFLPSTMPSSRKPVMEFRMVNKPHETSWKKVHDVDPRARYQPAKDDDDVITSKLGDLKVSCELEDGEPLFKTVSSARLRQDKHTVYFHLDLRYKADDSLVMLTLKQDDQVMVEIMFNTHFTKSTETRLGKVESNIPSSDKIMASQLAQMDLSGRTASGNVSASNEVLDETLNELVGKLGNHYDVGKLATNLGFTRAEWEGYRESNRNYGNFQGTNDMLFAWKRKTPVEEQRPNLQKALKDSDNAGFIHIL